MIADELRYCIRVTCNSQADVDIEKALEELKELERKAEIADALEWALQKRSRWEFFQANVYDIDALVGLYREEGDL